MEYYSSHINSLSSSCPIFRDRCEISTAAGISHHEYAEGTGTTADLFYWCQGECAVLQVLLYAHGQRNLSHLQQSKRDHSTIMVVENTRDLAAYEKTGKFEGVYHVLHGAILPMLGIGPDDIKLKELMQRLARKR